MLRTNGGLIGVQRKPTVASASGVWSLVEHVTYNRALLWPGTNPIPLMNPAMWWDFADSSTITLSGTQIASITDKGSLGRTLTSSTTGPTYSTTANGINGLRCCDWGAAGHNNYLRSTVTTSTDIADVYVVLDANYGSTFPTYNGLITEVSSSPGWIATAYAGATGFDNYNATPLMDQCFVNGSATSTYASGVLPSINSPSLLRFKKSTDAAFSSTKGFQIGNDRAVASRGWGGLIGEVVVFSQVLSSTNRSTLQSFLASKWGLTLS